MKKIYLIPEMDIIEAIEEDIICTSEKVAIDPNTPASSNIDDTLVKDRVNFSEDNDWGF